MFANLFTAAARAILVVTAFVALLASAQAQLQVGDCEAAAEQSVDHVDGLLRRQLRRSPALTGKWRNSQIQIRMSSQGSLRHSSAWAR